MYVNASELKIGSLFGLRAIVLMTKLYGDNTP